MAVPESMMESFPSVAEAREQMRETDTLGLCTAIALRRADAGIDVDVVEINPL
jgi:hypothetical protein